MQVMEFIKDFFISILLIVIIAIILSIMFYDEISLSKIIPKAEVYEMTQNMQKELNDDNIDDTQEVIINYYIDGSDLKGYEKENKYVKGKSNPFAQYTEVIENTNSENGNTASTTNDINSSSGNFYEDEGIK